MAMQKKRAPLRPSIRFEVFKRDGFVCQYCGQRPPEVILEVDHIVAVAEGGTDDLLNLLTACWECNRGKGKRALDSVAPSSEERMSNAREAAEQLREYNAFLEAERAREDEVIANLGRLWHNAFYPPGARNVWLFGPNRVPTVRQFLRQLPSAEIRDAIEIAIERMRPSPERDDRAWRYFCGVCWTKIRDRKGGGGR